MVYTYTILLNPLPFLSVSNSIPLAGYDSVHKGIVRAGSEKEALEKLFYIFNEEHLDDYKNRSLSAGDAVILDNDIWQCEMTGWTKIK